MAQFEKAYQFTAGIEAGYTVDNGGPTYRGIAFNNWQSDPLAMKIWAIVKAAKPAKGDIIDDPELDKMIMLFYKKNKWDKIKGDYINSQGLANLIYDFSVNSGSAIIIINKVVGGRDVPYMNETTLKALNDNPGNSYVAIRDARKALYDHLATKGKKFKRNYNGWMVRLNKFPKQLTA